MDYDSILALDIPITKEQFDELAILDAGSNCTFGAVELLKALKILGLLL